MPVSVTYPHRHPSLQPLPLSSNAISALAGRLREQICRVPHRPKVNLPEIIKRTKVLAINGITITLRVDVVSSLRDNDGGPALGVTEHAGTSNDITIGLNRDLLDGDEALARSTLLHEFGHVVFDAPGWIAAQHRSGSSRQRFLRAKGSAPRQHNVDWSEWRANALMGALLCPADLLQQWMVKRAAALGVPMVAHEGAMLPFISRLRSDHDQREAVILDLAGIFGLSPRFIETRLQKYHLIAEY